VDVDVGREDVRALRGEALGDRPAASHRRAGDDGDAAREIGHRASVARREDPVTTPWGPRPDGRYRE